jgi:hypothetical protein
MVNIPLLFVVNFTKGSLLAAFNTLTRKILPHLSFATELGKDLYNCDMSF